MRRKDLDYLVIALLLVSGLIATVTGVIADRFGLHRVTLHTYAGYASVVLAGAHLALNWRVLTRYVQARVRRIQQPRCGGTRPTAQPSTRPLLGRRALLVSLGSLVAGFLAGRFVRLRTTPAFDEGTDIGALYHEWSNVGGTPVLSPLLDWGSRPAAEKQYPGAERIALPLVEGEWGLSVGEALALRRSLRRYRSYPLTLDQLGQVLYAAQGITDGRGFRAAPSAGALYPLEVYVLAHSVSGLESGIYHYFPREHVLERLKSGDFRTAIAQAGLWQEFLAQAGVCLVLSAVFQRTRWRYRERAYRYVLLEAGHVAENIYLAATALGLGACAVGAFLDDEVNRLLGLDGKEEAALYILSLGVV